MTRSIHLTRLGLATVLAAFNFSAQLYAETAAVGCDATMMAGSIAQLSDNHATVHTSILINASKEDVWAALTDFDNMAYWSTGTLQSMSATSGTVGRSKSPSSLARMETVIPTQ
jgi:uncharacterized membrane protein